jgi:hypothetical protein
VIQSPPVPDLPPEQISRGVTFQRYEDITQDGRFAVLGLPHALGTVLWHPLLSKSSMLRALRSLGIVPVLTRLVLEGYEQPILLSAAIHGEGRYGLARTTDENGETSRLLINMWVELTGSRGKNVGPRPTTTEQTKAGRLFAEHVFTRPFAPAGSRRVVSFEGIDGIAPSTTSIYDWQPTAAAAGLPDGAVPLDETPRIEDSPVIFGLDHTDSNQHVNSLVYPRLFVEAALRRFQEHGRSPAVLARKVEVAYRKPAFAGTCLRIAVAAFEFDGKLGARGYFISDDEKSNPNRAHCFMRVLFAQ